MMSNTTQIQPAPWVQLPAMPVGMNRYLEVLQRQIKLTGELTATWVSAMNTLSDIVLAHGGPAGPAPWIGAWTAQRHTHSVADPDPDPHDRRASHDFLAAEVFNEVIELLVDDDIIAAVNRQATST